MAGIYIHVPFCKQACSYCDFYFVTREEHKEAFISALLREIRFYEGRPEAEEPIQTIYFGGGTPSRLPVAAVEQIMGELTRVFDVLAHEVTFEMNPDDVRPEYLEGLHAAGITRSSMGIQSFDPELLRFMHRAHTKEEALESLRVLSESPIRNFTVDLIYGNPGQQMEVLEQDLDTLLSFHPPHLSAYALTIESGTRLGKQLELARLVPADDELVAAQVDLIINKCAAEGIHRYEVSNFAREGAEAAHNSAYWDHQNYLGLGPGAHSFWWAKEKDQALRRSNKKDLRAYIRTDVETQVTNAEVLNLHTLAEERIMLGVRTVAGVSRKELKERYEYALTDAQCAWLEQQLEKGFVRPFGERIQLTEAGFNLADRITLDLLTVD